MFVFRYSSQEVEECEEEYEARCEITFQPELRNVSKTVCSNTTTGTTSLLIFAFYNLSYPVSDTEPGQEGGEGCEEVIEVITAQTPVETCTVNTRPRQDR